MRSGVGKDMGICSEDMRLKIEGNLETKINIMEVLKIVQFNTNDISIKTFEKCSQFSSLTLF